MKGISISMSSVIDVSPEPEINMKKQWFVGIDISKATLDAAVCQNDNPDQFLHRDGGPAAIF
ncbi:hypothetical protein [Telluribacter sp.]|jgi:hypothetical protein|uniref:hypothetical protein n=1 Tax=Telluribacter sp. TaxID=1978767 RepID=UPI002E0E0FCC|nr:hypothetical protein [Telluribacter sp.]